MVNGRYRSIADGLGNGSYCAKVCDLLMGSLYVNNYGVTVNSIARKFDRGD